MQTKQASISAMPKRLPSEYTLKISLNISILNRLSGYRGQSQANRSGLNRFATVSHEDFTENTK